MRLVSDDVVEIRKVSDETLVGSCSGYYKALFIELRGIGIVDVKTLFWRTERKRDPRIFDLVITLED